MQRFTERLILALAVVSINVACLKLLGDWPTIALYVAEALILFRLTAVDGRRAARERARDLRVATFRMGDRRP